MFCWKDLLRGSGQRLAVIRAGVDITDVCIMSGKICSSDDITHPLNITKHKTSTATQPIRSMRLQSLQLVFPWLFLVRNGLGFQRVTVPLRALALDTARKGAATDNLPGVAQFEEWQRRSGVESSVNIRHEMFGDLRGLAWTNSQPMDGKTQVATIPADCVLSSDFSNDDWDSQLARQLWEEVRKGANSKIYGYTSLLTQGFSIDKDANAVPTSLAPDALRHWTTEQKQLLEPSSAGQRLLEISEMQTEKWKSKYDSKEAGDCGSWMSLEQFVWSMEAVHSRAFCGLSSATSQFRTADIISLALPLVAAVAGYVYSTQVALPDPLVLIGLGLMAVGVPTALQLTSSSKEAVLLPLIDSANHVETSNSDIEFNVLKKSFELSVDSSCIRNDSSSSSQPSQLFISYGRKTDIELLLNYGFLPGMGTSAGSGKGSDDNSRRKLLADTFVGRNP